jgi:hypothetical protein
MKSKIFYNAEYRLVSAGGIHRGEIGGMTCVKSFAENELDDAINFLNKYKCYKCENIYDKSSKPLSKNEIPDDGQLYHYLIPKIWHMNLRADLRLMKFHEERLGKKSKWSDWTHLDGDTYVVKTELFNLKKRLMEHSNFECSSLQEAFENTKFKDTKTRLLSDWTLYSKHQYINNN